MRRTIQLLYEQKDLTSLPNSHGEAKHTAVIGAERLHRRTATVRQNIQLLWEQKDLTSPSNSHGGAKYTAVMGAERLDFTVQQCLMSDENIVHARFLSDTTLTDGDIRVCLSHDCV